MCTLEGKLSIGFGEFSTQNRGMFLINDYIYMKIVILNRKVTTIFSLVVYYYIYPYMEARRAPNGSKTVLDRMRGLCRHS